MTDSVTAQPEGIAPLYGRAVFLRPIVPSDYEPIRLAESTAELNLVWRNRGMTPSPENFVQRLWQNVVAQYLVVRRADPNRPIGIVMAYNPSFIDGYLYIGFARFSGSPRSSAFLEGAALFVDHIFTTWPIRKIYAEATEHTMRQFASGENRIFETEGRLKAHTYFRGAYVDQLILSCTHERWNERGRRFARWAAGHSASSLPTN